MHLFQWLRRRTTPPELTLEYVADVMTKYGALLEKYPIAYIDESWLPASKAEMHRVLRAAWKMTPDLRKSIEVGWISLYRFQPNIGQVPIDADLAEPERLNRFVELSKFVQVEMERDFEELSAFKAANQ